MKNQICKKAAENLLESKKQKIVLLFVLTLAGLILVSLMFIAFGSQKRDSDVNNDGYNGLMSLGTETTTQTNTENETEPENDETVLLEKEKTTEAKPNTNKRNTAAISHDGEKYDLYSVDGKKANNDVLTSPIAEKENTNSTETKPTVPNITDNSTVKPYYPLYQCSNPKSEIVNGLKSGNELYVGESDFRYLTNRQQQDVIDVLVVGYPNATYGAGNQKAFEATYAALMYAAFDVSYIGKDAAVKYAYEKIISQIGKNSLQSEIHSDVRLILNDSSNYQLISMK